ncbi:MAG: peptide-methionine (S)-S-oxide reductase [Flavobacteriaceae bacterium]|jgi:peptide-methionine (S)-S-oxide reductase
MEEEYKKIYLAGGCFWGMEDLFRREMGVIETTVGYTGGILPHPTYEKHNGHAEALEIIYDPRETSFETLLDFFFRIHDPTTPNQQGNDRGSAYRSSIFYQNKKEKAKAYNFIKKVNDSGRYPDPVVTIVEKFNTFWKAEKNHQDYLQNNPGGYTCHSVRWTNKY